MSNSIANKATEDAVLTWLHIDDFAAGCFDGSNVSRSSPVTPAQIGAANADTTYCCCALPQGGLGPLPKMAVEYTYTEPFPTGIDTLYIVGMAVNPGLTNGKTEIIIMLEGNGGSHVYIPYSYVPTTGSANIIATATITATALTGIFGSPYPTWTRAAATQTATDNVEPNPILVWPAAVATDSHGKKGHVFVYPDQLAPTTFKAQDLVDPTTATSGIAGQVVCYGNRILTLAGFDYTWPTGTGVNTNENIDFTTPPVSLVLKKKNVWLAAEVPWGYGAAGSISTGELLLVKKEGGGLVVNGDIAAPSSVIYLPGIQPTGDFYGHTGANDSGLFYCSEGRGAYVWNGGNASQKISSQLRDDFFDCQTDVIQSNNFGFFAQRWGSYMVFSNNYLYNTLLGSWWVLYPNETNGTTQVPGRTLFHWAPGRFGYQLWGAPLRMGTSGGGGLGWLYKFDNRFAAPHWQWESLPIHVVTTADRVVDVRQVVIRASSPSTNSRISVTIGSTTKTSTIPIGPTPTPIRFNIGTGALGLSDIVIRVNGDQTDLDASSPIIHSIDVGYRPRAHVPVDD